ncbi:MAG: glutathione synthase [Alphaproteobacteria bacterium]|nr:glutathione synthase [Alphaproteobacteria bacterium]
MSLKIAVQCDPIELFNIEGDSTFAMMLEAQARGHSLFYYHVKTLAYCNSKLSAEGHDVTVQDVKGAHYQLGPKRRIDLATQDVILMRQDPPFDMGYITATHLLDMIHPKTLVVNDPAEVRNAPEKLFILKFPDLMPPTLITRDVSEIDAFRREHGDVILKPLYGNGGAGVYRTSKQDQNFSSLLEMFSQLYNEPYIAQKYLPDVRKGDKRIILVDGKVAGAINRIPAEHDNRSNMHVGGQAAPTQLTKREHEICEAIGPDLKKRGLIFTGIDVIGDYMTEINVTSPTGIRQVKRFGGADIASLIMDAIEARR